MSRFVDLGYAAGWSLIKAMPRSLAWSLFRAGADRAARKRGPGAQRLRQNLRQVVGPEMSESELDDLVRDGLRSYARYWLEAFRLPTLSRDDVLKAYTLENAHRIGEAVDAGTGCVIALPHAGNWDFAGAYVCARGWGLTTVAERLKPESVYRRFLAFRESLGMEIIPLSGGQKPPLDVLEDRLAKAHVIPLLADRDLSSRGVEVTFFGGRTRMPAGPALLALRTGAPLFTCALWYDGERPMGRISERIMPPTEGSLDVKVKAVTQSIADEFAAGIAAHPADWHMLQKLWLPALGPLGEKSAVTSESSVSSESTVDSPG